MHTRALSLTLALALAPLPGLAGAPYCAVEEICKHTNDNCQPAEGRLVMRLLPSGKAEVQLDDGPAHESTVLQMQGKTLLIFRVEGEEHQLRLEADGKFNYLISIPDPDAPKGKDQTLYRGQCVEG